MTEEAIRHTTDVLMGRIVDMFREGQISICQAAERTLLIEQWATDRRETAGLVQHVLEEAAE